MHPTENSFFLISHAESTHMCERLHELFAVCLQQIMQS